MLPNVPLMKEFCVLPGLRSNGWMIFCLVVALAGSGCATDTQTESSGGLTLNLELSDDVEIDEVAWEITTGGGLQVTSGVIDVSALGSTISLEVIGLAPGAYTVILSAVSTDGETACGGAEDFEVAADETTEVYMLLRCRAP